MKRHVRLHRVALASSGTSRAATAPAQSPARRMRTPVMRLASRVLLALAASLVVPACGHHTPAEPSQPVTAAISDVRYERVKPVIADGPPLVVVTLWYALAPGDPYGRTTSRLCLLEQRTATTFVCPSARFEAVPVDREWSASVTDTAVSSLPVARDLYLNGTRIRVQDYANGAESGLFQIDAQGRVH